MGHPARRLPEDKQEGAENQVAPAHGANHLAHLIGTEGRAQLLVQGQADNAGRHDQEDAQGHRPVQRLTVEVRSQPQRAKGDGEHHQLAEEQAEALRAEGAEQARRLAAGLTAGLDYAVKILGRHAEQTAPENQRWRHKKAGQGQQHGKGHGAALQPIQKEFGRPLPERLGRVGRAKELQLRIAQRTGGNLVRGVGIQGDTAVAKAALAGQALPGGGLGGVIATERLVHKLGFLKTASTIDGSAF